MIGPFGLDLVKMAMYLTILVAVVALFSARGSRR